MNRVHLQITAVICVFSGAVAYAQSPEPAATSAVPKLVRFSGAFRPANGLPIQSMESVTLAVYRDQSGGAPLWQEIQNVSVDAEGHYSVLLGATKNDGMPLELFTSEEPRWVGAQLNRPGETEQPRVLLVSVPYALKASDAETLGGKPASAYLLAPSVATSVGDGSVNSSTPSSTNGIATSTNVNTAVKAKTVSGQINRVAKFVDAANDVGNSSLYDANGFIGIATVAPLISLDVRTGSLPQMGIAGATDYLTFFASDQFGPAIYWDPAKDMRFGKGGSGLYNPFGFVEQMRIQSSTGNVGIGTMAPMSKLDVAGNINFAGSVLYQGNSVLKFPPTATGAFGNNLGLGVGVMANNTLGFFNTAVGFEALQLNTVGWSNTAVGYQALQGNNGLFNTGIGTNAMANTTNGSNNTAVGTNALANNGLGNNNTAIGAGAMSNGTGGEFNMASGWLALNANTSGVANVADGSNALEHNTTGNANVAVGLVALQNNTTGESNTALGQAALLISTGSRNIAIGAGAGQALASGDNNVYIGSDGIAAESGIIRIGNSGTQTSFFAAGIRGVTTGANDAVPVVIDSNGQLGTVSSSRRFKDDVADMGDASRDLMRLRPVTYRYKQPFADGSKPIQYGLIAEEVSEVYPELVAHSADGQIETVKYQVLDSMLLNEMQRQEAEIRGLEEQNRVLQERLDKIEKVLTAISRTSGVPSRQ